jgi:hypothetical protein
MSRTMFALAIAGACAVMNLGYGADASAADLPSKADDACIKCHANYATDPGLFAGRLVDVSQKAKTIQLKIGKENEIIYYDDATELVNAEGMPKIPKTEAVRITYFKKDGRNFAKKVEVKKGLKVPEDKLAKAEDVAKLVELGPEKGKYILLDSRPAPLFNAGHIPTSVSMAFGEFDKLAEALLPKDKQFLQIYYCDGFT